MTDEIKAKARKAVRKLIVEQFETSVAFMLAEHIDAITDAAFSAILESPDSPNAA